MSAPRPVGRSAVRALLDDMLWLLPVPVLLGLAAVFGAALSDALVLACGVGLALLLLPGMWLRAVVRRRIFLRGAVREASRWHRWLRGGAGIAGFKLLLAVPLAALLLVAAVRPTGWHLPAAWVLNLPVFVGLWHLASRRLLPHALPRFRPILALRLAMVLNFALLFLVLAVAAVFQSYPDLGALTLSEAMLSEIGRQEARSEVLLILMQVAAAKDALVWWLGQQLLPGVMAPVLQFIGWAVWLAADAAMLWAYLVMCASVLSLVHWREWYPGVDRHDDESP